MDKEKFEAKLKELITNGVKEIVEPMAAETKTVLANIEKTIETKVSEIMEKTKAARIEMHDNELDDHKGGFKCFSHFCRDVARADHPSIAVTTSEMKRWKDIAQKIDKAAGTGMISNDPDFGGTLIPTEFRNTLLVAVEQSNDILPRTTPVPMGSTSIDIPYVQGFDESGGLVWGGIEWLWVDEAGAFSEKRPKVGKIGLKLKKLTGLAYVTDEILADSPQSMDGFLQRGFEQGLNFQYNRVLMRGTGAGQPLGALNAPCLVTITAETGQAAGTIYFENLVKMYARVYNPSNCAWYANPNTLPQLATMSLGVGTGGVPVWMPAGGISGRPYNTLFGLPLFFNDHCSTLGTVGDIMLADWSQYLVGRKSSGDIPAFGTSIHLKYDYGQTAYRFQLRLDGSPWWPTYYTPPQATSDTRSPFVVLASR